MPEQPFFFESKDVRLFGVFHESAAAGSREPIVLCHPFGEEKLWAHRVLVLFARRLAALGHPVLRFDYMGNGDSAGTFAESSVASMVADTGAAVTQMRMRTGAPRVCLIGLRLGGTIASLAAEQRADVQRLVLWAPIVDGARYMQELLRVNVSTQATVFGEVRQDRAALVEAMRRGHTVNLEGYELAHPLFSEVSDLRMGTGPRPFSGPSLFVQIDRVAGRPAPELAAIAARYPAATLRFALEEPFWKEIPQSYQREAVSLVSETLDWLATT